MGFMGSLEWLNYFDTKRCKSLFFSLRAKLKKALKDGAAHNKKQPRFQYDPSSYALNFDDGCFSNNNFEDGLNFDDGCFSNNNFEDGTKKKALIRDAPVLGFYTDVNNTTWVYLVWDLF